MRFAHLGFVLLVVGVLAVVSGCNKPDDAPPPNNTPNTPDTVWAPLTLRFHHQWGADYINATDSFYLDTRGLSISTAKIIVSNFRLVVDDTTELKIDHPGFVLNGLLTNGQNTITLPDVPTGNYRGIRFAVGLDSTINHQDPTVLPQEHPLARPDMHWSWAPSLGYVFIKLEGTADQTPAGDGSAAYQWFTLHLATDEMYRLVNTVENSPMTVDSIATPIDIRLNWKAMFQDVEMPTGLINHGNGRAYAGNFDDMFSRF